MLSHPPHPCAAAALGALHRFPKAALPEHSELAGGMLLQRRKTAAWPGERRIAVLEHTDALVAPGDALLGIFLCFKCILI